MTQVETIRKELLKGNSLTQRSALMDFGIMALPRRIADLKELGFPIKSEMKTNPLTGQRYAQYSFDEEVKSIEEMHEGCVYRVVGGPSIPFADALVAEAQGYFTLTHKPESEEDFATVRMNGFGQIFHPLTLRTGGMKVEYVGGIQ